MVNTGEKKLEQNVLNRWNRRNETACAGAGASKPTAVTAGMARMASRRTRRRMGEVVVMVRSPFRMQPSGSLPLASIAETAARRGVPGARGKRRD
jgi:hypothetical protein